MSEINVMEIVAGLMALSARTAPKGGGRDAIELKVLKGEELERLANDMVAYGLENNRKNFDRDGENVRRSDAVLLISLNNSQKSGLNCGACGWERCADLKNSPENTEFAGPICFWRAVDLGIAIGSAVCTAGLHHADNRVMYRVGVSARRLGLIPGEVVIGIPISATGKNIYFDR